MRKIPTDSVRDSNNSKRQSSIGMQNATESWQEMSQLDRIESMLGRLLERLDKIPFLAEEIQQGEKTDAAIGIKAIRNGADPVEVLMSASGVRRRKRKNHEEMATRQERLA